MSVVAATELLALLGEATRILHATLPLEQRIQRLFELLRPVVHFRDARLICWLQGAQPKTERQQFYSADGWPYPWDDSLSRRVALDGALVLRQIAVSNPAAAGEHLPVVQAAYLGAPIRWDRRLWGLLELRAETRSTLEGTSRELVAALLPQLAVAIAQAGQSLPPAPIGASDGATPTGLTLAPPRLQHLLELEARLETMLNLPELLSLLLRQALAATGAEAGAVLLVDQSAGELLLHTAEGLPATPWHGLEAQQHKRFSWDHGLAGQAARMKRALLVRDVTLQPELAPGGTGARAGLAAPIVIHERVVAVMLLSSSRSNAFGDQELAFMRALCDRAALPLSRTLHYQDALESANYLGQVFNNLPTGLALLDTNGKVVRVNPAWTSIWGIKVPQRRDAFHVGLDLIEVMLPRLTEPLAVTEFCRKGQRLPSETLVLRVRLINPVQDLHILSVPTRDSQKRISGRLWVVTDVTREGEADRLKNEFVSIVSHELRTPLTSILGYTELLLSREFQPEERIQFIKTVYDEAERLSKLVEDLLSVSRIEAGRLKLNRWLNSLNSIVNELSTQLNTQLVVHRLLLDVTPNLPPVSIDRDKIKQVIFNLLNNAIKYSPKGGEITLEMLIATPTQLPPEHPPGRWIRVAIHDQGMGIAPDDLPRIWERFYRVDNTNTRRIGGTGLGLSITKAIVELHGGQIWAESELGQGSSFFFSLPMANVEKDTEMRK
ncbi:ATP-binding protein [Candidatus Viridilinea mediisalina]|uniref:histidine kinase n=1 Tax=Candidatus Viridilinea mediisalina TaxID=2024553 RepID=A0A2A6RJF3_9CHLR|nr:ATP-binding protein [Candidatus Viridilinea mediisalina]PDW03026.1 histidine kinase [Candidatus Viridilinea mediisalina]